jgi:hypothetical protein
MAKGLIFPDGVRLVEWDEIPGPNDARAEVWKRVQKANIEQGFVLKSSDDERYPFYAELNVDAPRIWTVFDSLCRALFRSEVSLVLGAKDAEPQIIGYADISSVLSALGHYKYQLANDGFLHFGIVSEKDGLIHEVFLAEAKCFKVWLDDEDHFRSLMKAHAIPENSELEFLDEYPRVTIRLPASKGAVYDLEELASRLKDEIGVEPQIN